MRTLSNAEVRAELQQRLQRLTADTPRRWGRMTAHRMVCHLNDSFKAVTGEKAVSSIVSLRSRTLDRWIALHLLPRWPRGLPTRPEMDQEKGGTPPANFDHDVRALSLMIERFSQPARDFEWHPHPALGEMSERDWMRWGYLHVDHHLRQFGL